MQITGAELVFLVQVLEDSLEIQLGYDWCFEHKKEKRKDFHEKFIKSLLAQETINVQDIDLSKLLDK